MMQFTIGSRWLKSTFFQRSNGGEEKAYKISYFFG